ncbi:MAG TPA: DUF2007 domain-containing protein [Acidimicrobiia bacterium]|nr:DUF2007 domain-containing protein [Acidimicrobiia bacterium]
MRDDGVNHHDHDKIVELCRVPGRFEADVIVAKLRANGITASTSYADAGGYLPRGGLLGGDQILVFDSDLERAQTILDEEIDLYADPEA